MDPNSFFIPADDEHIKKEKRRAQELRQSQWWKNQLARGICYYCKKRFHPNELTMDHIVPIIRGGKSTKSNVVPACSVCNQTKGYRLPVEWMNPTLLNRGSTLTKEEIDRKNCL